MRKLRTPSQIDPELELIDKLEAAIIRAHDQKLEMGAPADQVARERPGVVALAAAVCDQLRAEYRARGQQ